MLGIPRDPETGWFIRTREGYAVWDYSLLRQLWPFDQVTFVRRCPLTETITWTGQGERTFHSCVHSKIIQALDEGEATSEWIPEAGHPWAEYDPNRRGHVRGSWDELPMFTESSGIESIDSRTYSRTLPDYPGLPDLDWLEAREKLYADVFGRFPADTSVPLNILEFKQLRRLAPGFVKNLTELIDWCKRGPAKTYKIRVRHPRSGKSYYTRFVQRNSRVSVASLQWGLKDLSDSWLSTQFGLKPLIGDVTNWVTKYYELKLKADWFNLMAQSKPVHFHASTKRVTKENVIGQMARMVSRYAPDTIYSGNPIYVESVQSVNRQGVLGMVARVKPKPAMAQLNAKLASVLGLTAPLQTVWDIIPFSFVADWILPIGKTVARVDQRLFGSQAELAEKVEILSYWHSIKTDTFSGMRRPPGSMISVGRAPGQVRCTYLEGRSGREVQTYERYEGWPNVSLWPRLKGWTPFASITTAALGVQRAFR